MYKKNEIIELTIEDMGVEGEGIGKLDGYTFFVKGALDGDRIEAKVLKANKNYGFARVERILTPSPYRVEAQCDVSEQCGGCQLQSLSYERQLQYKQNLVDNNLRRLGGLSGYTLHPIIGMENPFRYRNKTQFPVGQNSRGEIVTGFYAGRTHSIIDTADCAIAPRINAKIIQIIKDFMRDNGIGAYDEISHGGLVRHILIRNAFSTGEIMVCLVINGSSLPFSEDLIGRLEKVEGMAGISLSINRDKTNVIMGSRIIHLYGKETITDYIGDLRFEISPLSFYQVNPVQTLEIYKKALEYAGLTGRETVWDLYCGIGTISLFLAGKAAKVYGVEIIPQAIEDAKKNASANQIENVEFILGKSEEVFPQMCKEEGRIPDVVVVDPPRKGCDEKLLKAIVEVGPSRMVYVSCNPATLARDLKYMTAQGYEVREVQPVDNFPGTVHVESVVLLSRTEGTTRAD
ncbi:23S rRNA (uracil(1939)-C(5))-methyltransferase RlmD [Parasporobacterium paucivorans]|uniref:23S rRNA m(5)U-1939 methyltransferase n=1 Tax=Parasporobacterium paucivorans DSM 15970 TaxID=1122934 RepID=A0A1M6CW34_9FIRM|nr:23S rRNA (uracil(1939)-C(5))-methyltransferase RlmD [Parasporobacterium paucivorans]SHI65169.1 23S rRNA m(5)U-1939 methyltransferase [Parasporobacterium paucivorans DSM 15970]